MARQCTICASDQRQNIEAALLDGIPEVRIAEQYGVSRSAVGRHRKGHLAPALWRALERREDLSAEALVARIDALNLRLAGYEARAARDGDWHAIRGLAAEQRATSELIARLRGDLDAETRVHIDARRQTAVLASMSEDELRALARQAAAGELDDGDGRSPAALPHPSDCRAFPAVTG